MCGICGIATGGEEPDVEVIRRMCATIAYRGPDGEGVLTAPGIGLGMRRLAIIDLATGWQPIGNETGSVQVVFNGEIYNYPELRRELEQRGHRFRTRSDTEVIPHLYEEYGTAFAAQLNGIFAIALWDAESRRLLLLRDRAGIKPLLYAVRDGRLYFGSELKCILAAGGTGRELDLLGLDQFLTFEHTASPRTLIEDVRKLPPAGWLVWQNGGVSTGAFWQLPREAPRRGLAEAEWAERVRTVIDAAVRRQMISDVPLGSFLSGGIDSSIIVSAMSRAASGPVRTFSIGFGDSSYDELRFARLVAQRYHTEHHEAILEPSYLPLVERVIHHLDQPIADFSVFPTLLVSEVARREVTVVLSGDGGDELFAGYETYVADRLAQRSTDLLPAGLRQALILLAGRVPPAPAKQGFRNRLRRFLEGAGLPREWQHMRWMTVLSPEQRRELYLPEFYRAVAGEAERVIAHYLDNPGDDRLQRQLYCDTRLYLPDDILVKVDLMGMATSLETRVPYLDNEVLALATSMPSDLKWRGGTRKHILKRAYAERLPPEILRRGKEGFSIPLKNWLQREWNGLMHDLLSEPALRRDGLVNPATVARWMAQHEQGRANHSHILWALMVFRLWKDRFLAASPPAPEPMPRYSELPV